MQRYGLAYRFQLPPARKHDSYHVAHWAIDMSVSSGFVCFKPGTGFETKGKRRPETYRIRRASGGRTGCSCALHAPRDVPVHPTYTMLRGGGRIPGYGHVRHQWRHVRRLEESSALPSALGVRSPVRRTLRPRLPAAERSRMLATRRRRRVAVVSLCAREEGHGTPQTA